MDLAQRFDLRFIVMQDRWDRNTFSERSVEDLKERYYSILDKLERVHGSSGGNGVMGGGHNGEQNKKQFVYDADHERRRKEQLRRLYNRTHDQVRIILPIISLLLICISIVPILYLFYISIFYRLKKKSY